MEDTQHIPVLFNETIDALSLENGDTIVDGTLGGGGHARAICAHIGSSGTLIGIDRDSSAIIVAEKNLADASCTKHLVNDNVRNLDSILASLGVDRIDSILLDLGWSSIQIAQEGRGLSFMRDEPLLMTLDPNPDEDTLTAREIVNEWAEESIADIIYGYGEERYARRIARAICEKREEEEIDTTGKLVDVISGAVPKSYHHGRIHPATRTFQALRIAVNDELGSAKDAIRKGVEALKPGGRIAIISFHSIEDRMVKHTLKELAEDGMIDLVVKKPIVPSDEEVRENPRARSAKLRIAEKRV
ncbi:MAG: 16S rRNA (cytosine(1402)-N(4))-methyltransferase RsmH [Parcubacteria group bacterium]|nr:16S rRNA (cytosine(1402)-N(4))-methyltransferase RsmH [Parcubacteria group bacterium]